MSRKIAFDLWRTGLGNNGGSRTLVKCAKTLAELGCEVRMYSDVANQYTWDHSWKKNVKFMCEKEYPIPQDFIVFATGFWSIKHVLQRRKHINDDIYIYIRGHEKWNTSSEELRGLYGKFPSGHCIVNSGWLFKYLEEYGIKSKLIYPGIDDVFKIKPKIQKENIIGALYSKRHKTKRHQDAKEVSRLSGYPVRMLNKHKKNPSEKQLNKWYNQFKVWFAPTELEGLHNCPIEASQAGCAVVCSDHPRNGMSDYAKHEETALVYPARDLDTASKYIKQIMEDEDLRLKLNQGMIQLLENKIKTRKENMIELRDYIFSDE